MKRTFVVILILITMIPLVSQKAIWPIQGKSIGEGIIYKPQDFINNELNFANLFINADEGTEVVSPVSGTVKSISYIYLKSLTYSTSSRYNYNDSININEFDKGYRESFAEYHNLDPRFVSISIGLKSGKGEMYYISGLRPFKFFKTGTQIKKGDIIGKVGYSYHKIKKPSINISRSMFSKPADPMNAFGLKSTFTLPSKSKIDYNTYKHSISSLITDFMILKNALEEGHPGLYDYVSKREMANIFDNVKAKITKPLTSEEFRLLLLPILIAISDSHTAILTKRYKRNDGSKPPILFGHKNDSIFIFSTLPEYKEFLGKTIINIDGVSSKDLIAQVNNIIYGSDGYIKSLKERKNIFLFWKYYGELKNKKHDDKITLKYLDGSEETFNYSQENLSEYIPKFKHSSQENFSTSILAPEIAFLDLNTFKLLNNDLDSIGNFIKSLSNHSIQNLIIDVRNNSGGDPEAIDKIFSFIAQKPFQQTYEKKVLKNGKYDFFKHTSNFSTDEKNIFPNFKSIDKKDGFYITNEYFKSVKPDQKVNYTGSIYILINGYSLSAATVFPALIHKYKRGKIIGQETGSSYHRLNATKFAKVFLDNSSLELYMPLIKSTFAKKDDSDIPWGRGVIPDIKVDLTIDDMIGDKDNTLDTTINYIKNQKKLEDKTSKNNYLYLLGSLFILFLITLFFNKLKSKKS